MIRAQGISYSYPFQNRKVLQDIDFQVGRGEILLVTGPSGCGKSTLLKVINGLIPHHVKGTLSGLLDLDGHPYPPDMAGISRRIGTLLQNPDDQFLATTVEDEVALSLEWQPQPAEVIRQRVDESLHALRIKQLANRSVFSLSQGEKQKCEIAALLAGSPDVVVMDEPTANLSPEATAELREICMELKARGVTLILVDHRLYWLHGVVDHLIVLSEGKKVFSATRRQSGQDPLDLLARHPSAAEWGLRSTSVEKPHLNSPSTGEAAAVEIHGLSFRYPRGQREIFNGFSACIPEGVVTALAGGNGAGKTTLARLLCGLEKPREGMILHDGRRQSRRQRRRETAFVMQQMEVQLVMRTVVEELLFSAPAGTSKPEKIQQARQALNAFHLHPLSERHPHSLSGGEKQRLVIACALMKQPRLLILDEPTSGLDGRNMRMIGKQLTQFAKEGGTVLVITHDLELLQSVAQNQITIQGEP